MANRQSARHDGRHHGARLLHVLGDELREARLRSGLTQSAVARSLGTTRRRIGLIERGRLPSVPLGDVARHGGVVGLRLHTRFYPIGAPIRDQAQVALLTRFRTRVPSTAFQARLEALIPGDRDGRAWDLLLWNPETTIGVEAITRLRDVQAQIRAAQLKRHDAGVRRLVLLVGASRANRRALSEADALIRSSFPIATRAALAAFAHADDPGGDALVLL
jgi:transcriptional regulator with XRE-family HTH domain